MTKPSYLAGRLCCSSFDDDPNWRRSMNNEKNKLGELFAACWKDEALKARF